MPQGHTALRHYYYMTYTSSPFRTPAVTYFRIAAMPLLIKSTATAVLCVAAASIAALWDVRFLFVALMLLFVIIPPIIAMVYFTRLLTPQAQYQLALKRVLITPGSDITVEYLKPADDDSEPELTGRHTIQWDAITDIDVTAAHVVFRYDGGKNLLAVPAESIDGLPPEVPPFECKRN